MISYPPSDVLCFHSLPSRGLSFKNNIIRAVLNRENKPLIFPSHFMPWPLNATYFCAAALQVKDTVAKYHENCIS